MHLSALPWSPWVNGVVGAFKDELNLYLMLEYIPSGCFYDLIQTRGPFNAATARFYFANIVSGLYFLHGEKIIHRDLKPANILVRPDGYLAIADFGYARLDEIDNGPATEWLLIGTPLYMAPELLCYQHMTGYGVDWWAAGVTLYEMLTKRTVSTIGIYRMKRFLYFPHHFQPFFGTDENKIFKRISSGKYKWPKGLRVGADLKSIVAGLLTTSAEHRLGVEGSVLDHPWLENIDFDKLDSGNYMVCPLVRANIFAMSNGWTIQAPWIPEVPAPTQTWLNKGLPPQQYIPGLKVCPPAVHREWDDRLPRKQLPI
jgi:protein kinase X